VIEKSGEALRLLKNKVSEMKQTNADALRAEYASLLEGLASASGGAGRQGLTDTELPGTWLGPGLFFSSLF
jgi:hypothetical protein